MISSGRLARKIGEQAKAIREGLFVPRQTPDLIHEAVSQRRKCNSSLNGAQLRMVSCSVVLALKLVLHILQALQITSRLSGGSKNKHNFRAEVAAVVIVIILTVLLARPSLLRRCLLIARRGRSLSCFFE